MKVLSLFDGVSCARVALDRAGIPVEEYYASEIDKYAIDISGRNWSEIEHIGGVENVYFSENAGFDLLIGGSPCQDLSIAGKRKGLAGDRSGLFYEYVRILRETKPRYFVLENVASMSKESRDIITRELGVEPIMIDASLVSGQQRKRLFWTNIPGVTLPEDRGIMLKDVLQGGEVDRDKSYCIDASYYKGANWVQYKDRKRRQLVKVGYLGTKDSQANRIYLPDGKSVALSALGGGGGAKTGLYLIQTPRGKNNGGIREAKKSPTLTSSSFEHNTKIGYEDGKYFIVRKLTPIECERLQGLPDGYTQGVSNTQRYKALGNAFNADVIAHILSFIPNKGE